MFIVKVPELGAIIGRDNKQNKWLDTNLLYISRETHNSLTKTEVANTKASARRTHQ